MERIDEMGIVVRREEAYDVEETDIAKEVYIVKSKRVNNWRNMSKVMLS